MIVHARAVSQTRAERGVAAHPTPQPSKEAETTGLLILLGLAIVHAILVWGYGGLFWGDNGRWLHEIDRYASGQVVYRDFYWGFPPLAMWLLGGYARAFGSGLSQIWVATSAVFVTTTALYYYFVVKLVPSSLAFPTAAVGWLLAIAFANVGGVPLPLGAYTPAAALGFLLVLGSLVLTLELLQRGTALRTAGLGVLCGLCILTKQDYWPPALFLLATAVGAQIARDRRISGAAVLPVASFLLTIALGASVIVAQSSLQTLGRVAGGFGNAAEYIGRGFPSWERFTVEVVAGCSVGLIVIVSLYAGGVISLREARRQLLVAGLLALSAGVVYVAAAYHIAGDLPLARQQLLPPMAEFVAGIERRRLPLLQPVLGFLLGNVLLHLLPALLPAVALLVVLWKRSSIRSHQLYRPVLLLLGFCIAARLRRLFEGVEWYHFLLELPTYVLVLQLLLHDRRAPLERGLRIALAVFALLGGYAYFRCARGPLTDRGRWEVVRTRRGRYRMPPGQASDYRWLEANLARIDPTGTRPLFAFGYSGGFNYFLNRPNHTPISQGFMLANVEPRDIVSLLSSGAPPPILLDSRAYNNIGRPARRLAWTTWEAPVVQNQYWRFDRPYFERVLRNCVAVAHGPNPLRPFFTLYDCGKPPS